MGNRRYTYLLFACLCMALFLMGPARYPVQRGEKRIMSVRDLLIHHEGLRLDAYKCPGGFWTIGVGHNIEARGLSISYQQAMRLLDQDLKEATAGASRIYPRLFDLDEVRQAVIISLVFQIGEKGAAKFKRTLTAIAEGRYTLAAKHLLESKVAKQTPNRIKELASMLEHGVWPE